MPKRTKPRSETPYYAAQDLGAAIAIKTAWKAHDGSGTLVAKSLGISRTSLYREIERLGIGHELEGYRPMSAKGA